VPPAATPAPLRQLAHRIPAVPWRMPVAAALLVTVSLAGCGSHASTSRGADQAFVNSVYSQAPDIGGYRTGSQLLSLGQAICADLESGATVEEVGDRIPLLEGSSPLPPDDLGVVIAAAVNELCPKFHALLGQ
jgi:hypothetical protein